MDKRVLYLILSVFFMYACSEKEKTEEKEKGFLVLNISQGTNLKTEVELTDFILRISDSSSEILKGRIGDLPGQLALPEGNYTVEVYSMEFSEPKFEMPFYYGQTTVEIVPGVTKEAALTCSQGNAGVRIIWSNDFSVMYSTYQAQINSNEGYLHYSSSETRTGYFLPGTVSITIMADGQTINGGAITLAAQDQVIANLQVKEATMGDLTFNISIDYMVNERELEIIIDPDDIASLPNSETNPYTVAQAIERQGLNETGVWVTGYIVGSRSTSGNSANFVISENWRDSNVVLADNKDETASGNCISVELPSATQTSPPTHPRLFLNLIDNPENLHRKVIIRGNLASYFSNPGLRNVGTGANNYYLLEQE